ncbi:hypothetical protein C8R45DRAFT_1219998 [Mycena sanguinolenta]|nr:hypothetical protein C8R45DRAFT_1219998 [Mycena sanguinolenta]
MITILPSIPFTTGCDHTAAVFLFLLDSPAALRLPLLLQSSGSESHIMITVRATLGLYDRILSDTLVLGLGHYLLACFPVLSLVRRVGAHKSFKWGMNSQSTPQKWHARLLRVDLVLAASFKFTSKISNRPPHARVPIQNKYLSRRCSPTPDSIRDRPAQQRPPRDLAHRESVAACAPCLVQSFELSCPCATRSTRQLVGHSVLERWTQARLRALRLGKRRS